VGSNLQREFESLLLRQIKECMQRYETVRIRGVGFAPEKREILVLPPDVTAENLDEYIASSELPVSEAAVAAVLGSFEED
jgi:hypothetical protein